MNDTTLALLGDHEAAKRLTDAGVLLSCPWCNGSRKETNNSKVGYWVFCFECGADGPTSVNEYEARFAWNIRAPILSEREMEMLEGMKNG